MTYICLYIDLQTNPPTTKFKHSFQPDWFNFAAVNLDSQNQQYLIFFEAILELLNTYSLTGLNLAIPGSVLRQIEHYEPLKKVITKLANHPTLEYLAQPNTGFNPQTFSSEMEFYNQVKHYQTLIENILQVELKVFLAKNFYLSNQLLQELARLSFQGVFVTNYNQLSLINQHPNFVYWDKQEQLKLLIHNETATTQLEDILFQENWDEIKVFVESLIDSGEVINLMLNWETLLNKWELLEELIIQLKKYPKDLFLSTASQVLSQTNAISTIALPDINVSTIKKHWFSSTLDIFGLGF
jgi:hypothetical protein